MGFEVFDSVDYLDTSALKFVCALEVSGFIEASFEFYEDGDLFAVFCSTNECIDDTRVTGCSVEDLFDGEGLRVSGCFFDESDYWFEAFIGVVE